MNPQFQQPKKVVAVEVNKQSIARDFGVKHSEVCYFKPTEVVFGYKVIYDKATERAYSLPATLTAGETMGTLTNGVLVTSLASYDLGALAVERGELNKLPTTFMSGGIVIAKNDTVGLGAKRYRWAGSLPYSFAQGSSLASAGGLGATAWVEVNAEYAIGKLGASLGAWTDVVHIRDFTQAGNIYANPTVAVQAALNAAKASTSKVLDARGWQSGTLSIDKLVAEGIHIIGGQWTGDRDFWMHDCTFEGMTIQNMRIMPKGGDNRIFNCLFEGHPRGAQAATICFQHLEFYDQTILPGGTDKEREAAAGNADGGTFQIENCEFTGGYYGILQQPSGGKISRGLFRNLTFHDMMSDPIELNVIQRSYDNGCIIENIAIFGVDGTDAPIGLSNWGIGIGIAGKGPYGWAAPDENYCKNVTIRNIYAERCRQIVHVEVGRNINIQNVVGHCSNKVSLGTGLIVGTVFMYGCKEFAIDGISGEPDLATVPLTYPIKNEKGVVIGTGTQPVSDPKDIRIVGLEWGNNAPRYPNGADGKPDTSQPQIPPDPGFVYGPACPCNNYVVRNVTTQTGRVYFSVSAGLDGNLKEYDNLVLLENIKCHTFTVFGVARELNMANIRCKDFDGIGQYSAGDGVTGDGWYTFGRAVLNMVNVNSNDDPRVAVFQGWSKCRYTEINIVGSNVTAIPYTNFLGNNGVPMGCVGRTFFPADADHGQDGSRFPTGRMFNFGDVVYVMERARIFNYGDAPADRGSRRIDSLSSQTQQALGRVAMVPVPYIVTTPGAFIPDTTEAAIKAVGVGSTQLVQNLPVDGTSTGSPWLYVCQFCPGTPITIPGAGANGGPLNTYVVKAPYQTPANDPGRPITMDIAHPIQTAVPAGTRIKATYPIQTRPRLEKWRSSYAGLTDYTLPSDPANYPQ